MNISNEENFVYSLTVDQRKLYHYYKNAATEFINSFSVSNSCECHTCRAMRKYNETIKQLEQQ